MSFRAAPLRLVLADDDVVSRDQDALLLTGLGHEVVGRAASPDEAAQCSADAGPDVVLLALCMPDSARSLATAEEIVRMRPTTAVVLVSDDPACRLDDQQVASLGSAITLLYKPVPPGVLDSVLRLAVARARALHEARSEADQARRELESRKVIERAKGILMRRTGSSEAEAYAILRRTSQDRSVPMVDVARTVLQSEPGMQAR